MRYTRMLALFHIAVIGASSGYGKELPLPERRPDAITGGQFAEKVSFLSLEEREREIMEQILAGNIPDFLRQLSPIQASTVIGDGTVTAEYHVTPDYLAIGSDEDYFLCPMTPMSAQRLADSFSCCLPTRKMVDDIYSQARAKMEPSPIAPSKEMITVPVFVAHNSTVGGQRVETLKQHPLGALVAGHKKDVVIQ